MLSSGALPAEMLASEELEVFAVFCRNIGQSPGLWANAPSRQHSQNDPAVTAIERTIFVTVSLL
jgi:hypothetical protein